MAISPRSNKVVFGKSSGMVCLAVPTLIPTWILRLLVLALALRMEDRDRSGAHDFNLH